MKRHSQAIRRYRQPTLLDQVVEVGRQLAAAAGFVLFCLFFFVCACVGAFSLFRGGHP